MSKKIVFEKIGEVHFQKSSRAKNIILRVKPQAKIQVSVPKRTSFKTAERFVLQKTDWVLKALEKVKTFQENSIIFSDETIFKTYFRTLKIRKHDSSDAKLKISETTFEIFLPTNWEIKSEITQSKIRGFITQVLRKEAKNYLPQRTLELATQFNFKVNRVFIKNAKTRWGSCSNKNNINLNLNLLRLPQSLIDYVILHELSHTVHHNHSKNFWDLLNKVTLNQAKILDQELKNYRIHF